MFFQQLLKQTELKESSLTAHLIQLKITAKPFLFYSFTGIANFVF